MSSRGPPRARWLLRYMAVTGARPAAGKTIAVTIRGVPFVLEAGAGANAKGVAAAFENASATA